MKHVIAYFHGQLSCLLVNCCRKDNCRSSLTDVVCWALQSSRQNVMTLCTVL